MDSVGKLSKDTMKQSQHTISDTIKDSNAFLFWNGDRYEGGFLATKQPLTMVKDGEGSYYTSDGSVYKGYWNKDLLEQANEITFPDQSKFRGTLDNMTIEGPGVFSFKEGVEIRGNFISNQLVDEIELKDPTGHYWKASQERNEYEIIFHPIQPFWQSINEITHFVIPYNEAEGNFLEEDY